MATQENICVSRGYETLLSKRVLSSSVRSRFHSNNARWSEESAGETHLAFDITWDGPNSPSNAFEGYGVLVRLSKERLDGDLVLLIRPGLEDLALAYADGDGFVDACSQEKIAADATVLGSVVAERQFLSERQLFSKAKAFKLAEYAHHHSIQGDRLREAAFANRIESAIGKAQQELKKAVAALGSYTDRRTTVFWEFSQALEELPAYKQVRDRFREDDVEVHANPQVGDLPGGRLWDRDLDGPLKELVSLVYRAGQYAGPEAHMLDPNPNDYEFNEVLIANSLKEADAELARENAGFDRTTESHSWTGYEICSALIGMPDFREQRD